jgi:hypothetical protein
MQFSPTSCHFISFEFVQNTLINKNNFIKTKCQQTKEQYISKQNSNKIKKWINSQMLNNSISETVHTYIYIYNMFYTTILMNTK